MPDFTKIATCSYCGTRALLRLKGRERHELSCSACGAPLHLMKPLRIDRPAGAHQQHRYQPPARPWNDAARRRDRKQGRRRKGGLARIAAKLWDEIEDLID